MDATLRTEKEAPADAARETPTLDALSRPGRRAVFLPPPGVAPRAEAELVPPALARRRPAELPEMTELDLVRHYTRLSRKNFAIDTSFYPLGSCTMKFNPRADEAAAALPGFLELHPYQPDDEVQGALEVMHELERMLAAVTGLAAVSLAPAAGAHGELAGLLCVRAYHRDRGDFARTKVLVPLSAHGTNPASATLSGLDTVPVRTAADGGVDMRDFAARLDGRVAAAMITNPSTLGLFERNIAEIAARLHAAGALLYMDGANMNAILGLVRPGDCGVDVMQMNLHKTFATPHGGGGPGSGPIAVAPALEPFLPAPRVVCEGARYRLDHDRPKSIGRVKAFYGQAASFWRAYAWLRTHAPEDLRAVAENAVLNANYVLARLRGRYDLPYAGPCMHEVVFSARRQKARGVRAWDIAKRLLDYGFHPPTVYFPLVVEEALMIEPTECESKETLDAFCDAMLRIADEAEATPEVVRGAPWTTPVGRVDEAAATKDLALRVARAAGGAGDASEA